MTRIPDEVVERLKTEVDLAQLVIRSGVALKKAGRDLVGACPFHDDDTPSLMVTPSKGLWHCMGACQAGGTAIDWVMRTQGVSFRHAVELLRAGEVPTLGPGKVVRKGTIRRLPAPVATDADDAEALAQVVAYYHATLAESPEALGYLAQRHIDNPEVVERFCLGYSNRTLGLRLPAKNRRAGAEIRGRLQRLGVIRDTGHEHLRGSLVIPVIDAGGTVTELYGRKVRDDLRSGTPKHLYLPGPHRGVWNEAGLVGGEVIVCESLIDALSFYCAGFTNVTASYGTAGFTPDHTAAFERCGVTRVLIAYDNDQGGRTAAGALAEGLMASGIECFRISFPEGYDANDVARSAKSPADALAQLVRRAEWMGAGPGPGSRRLADPAPGANSDTAPTHDPAPPATTPLLSAAAVLPAALAEPPPPVPPPVPSPVPEVPAGPEVTVTGDELTMEGTGRTWRVRGIAKVHSFESAKVNVAVRTPAGTLHLDTFDLYASRARAAFVREAAAELGCDEGALKKELGRVLLAVEQTAATPEDAHAAIEMTEAERTEAMALLTDCDLARRIEADVATLGVVGEETNALLCYLACVSRKCERPLGVLVQSSSSAGKSTLAEAVLALCPPEDTVAYSAMTGQSLFYLGNTDLSHKVLAIAEEEGAARATYALKLLQSEGRLSIASAGKDPVSGKLVTHTYEVAGPVALLTTTTALDVDEELANRLMVLCVKEDPAQTRAIHAAQRAALTLAGLTARHERTAVMTLHRNAQRLLAPLPVVVPGAAALDFADTTTRSRRDHAKYLGLICVSALLHQHQRPILTTQVRDTEVRYIEATASDVALADRLAADVLVRDGSELAPATRRVLDALVAWAPGAPFTRRAAREALGVGDTQLKVHLSKLVALEYVAVARDGNAVTYELTIAPPAQPARSAGSVPGPGTTTTTRSDSGPGRSGETAVRSDPGRRAVGVRSDPEPGPFSQPEPPIDPEPVGFPRTRELGPAGLVLVEDAGAAAQNGH